MLVSFPVALAMLAPAAEAAADPAAQAQAPAPTPSTASESSCPAPAADSTTIVICTQRPNGYRLDPDIMEAKREMHSPGRPVRPGTETPRPDCATVGPMPCARAGIDLLAAALTAAEMAKRLAKGQEVGSMFLTDPHPDEYHLYLMAKERREAEEAQKAAAAKAKSDGNAQTQAPAEGN
jgi:hypothetical protein